MVKTRQSLLRRIQDDRQSDAWLDLVRLYVPMIDRWLNRFEVVPSDRADIIQEVLLAVVREIDKFEHPGRLGAFRAWLKNITINRCRQHWDRRDRLQRATGSNVIREMLDELEDEHSVLSKQWNEEHDAFLLRTLLERIAPEFDTETVQLFRRLAIDGESAKAVAESLKLPIAKVYKSRFRVMQRLREEAGTILDLEGEI